MRCLVITPKRFYVFHEFLAEALERLGYQADIVNEEYPENIIGVLLGNFIPPVSRALTLSFFTKYLSRSGEYDFALIIKGRGMSSKTVNLIKRHAKKTIGYNFDSFRYNPSPLEWKRQVDEYATFDHQDSKDHSLKKVELFASIKDVERVEKTVDLSVVLKNHSDRLLYLDQISSLFPKIKSEIFIYERNIFTLVRNFLTHPLLTFKWRKHISFTPLDYKSYLGMINRSEYTLDFAHPKQTGTTIRCFEALACKTRIISNNKWILTNPAFNADNAIIHPLDGDVDKLFALIMEKKKVKAEYATRTIDDFIDELLSEEESDSVFTQKTRSS